MKESNFLLEVANQQTKVKKQGSFPSTVKLSSHLIKVNPLDSPSKSKLSQGLQINGVQTTLEDIRDQPTHKPAEKTQGKMLSSTQKNALHLPLNTIAEQSRPSTVIEPTIIHPPMLKSSARNSTLSTP